MMKTPAKYEALLCLDIIQEHFGSIVKDVVQVLFRREGISLADIMKLIKTKSRADIKPSQVRDALLILGQHNILRMRMKQSDTPTVVNLKTKTTANVTILYEVSCEDIVTRLRFPKFMYRALELFGRVGEYVVEELCLSGRMKLEELVQVVEQRVVQAIDERENVLNSVQMTEDMEDETLQEIQKLEDEIQELRRDQGRVQEVCEAMIKRRYLVRVHPVDFTPQAPVSSGRESKLLQGVAVPKSASGTMGGLAGKKRAGASALANGSASSSVKGIKRKRPTAAENQKKDANAIPLELRLLMMKAEEGSGAPPKEVEVAPEPSSASPSPPPSTKRRRVITKGKKSEDGMDADRAASPSASSSSLVWRLGFDQFHRDLRHLALIKLASEQVNDTVSTIVKTVIDLTQAHERDRAEPVTAAVTARNVYDALPKGSGGVSVPWQTFLKYLEIMCWDKTGMLKKTVGSDSRARDGGTYTVQLAKMIDFLRQKTIHTIIQEKYGIESARIVQVLKSKKQLEQQQFEKLALIPTNDARRRLYELLRDHIVKLQEIPQRADYNPQQTFYTWSVDDGKMLKVIVEQIYHALLNLRLRRNHDFSRNKDLVERSLRRQTDSDWKARGAISGEGGEESDPLGADAAKYELLNKALDRLDQCVGKIDDTLQLFCIY